jgi:hypothetical protein
MLISTRARSSESRTGENPMSGLMRGLEEIYAYAYLYQILNGWRSPWKDRFQQHAYTHNIALLYSRER